MDLLFKRYASPFLLLDEMARTEHLTEFIKKFVDKENEDLQWKVWLHKVWDMSFEEYKRKVYNNNKQNFAMTDEQVNKQIKESRKILKGFKMK